MNEYIPLIIPIVVFILVQCLKAIIDLSRNRFSWAKAFTGYGGMPSSHATVTSSVCTIVALFEGIHSIIFVVSLFFTLIILRDAVGFRADVGEQGKVINSFIKKLPDTEEYEYPVFEEKTGHTIPQVFFGVAFGVVVTTLLYWLFV